MSYGPLMSQLHYRSMYEFLLTFIVSYFGAKTVFVCDFTGRIFYEGRDVSGTANILP